MTWVHRSGGADKVYRTWLDGDLFEVTRDATVYRLTNRTETRRFRPDQVGKLEHFTLVRVRGSERRFVMEEVRRQTSGAWPAQWWYRLTAKWRTRK